MIDKSVVKRLAAQTGLYGMAGGTKELYLFANAIAAHQIEIDAAICQKRYIGDNNREDMEARRCAEAIRNQGEPK